MSPKKILFSPAYKEDGKTAETQARLQPRRSARNTRSTTRNARGQPTATTPTKARAGTKTSKAKDAPSPRSKRTTTTTATPTTTPTKAKPARQAGGGSPRRARAGGKPAGTPERREKAKTKPKTKPKITSPKPKSKPKPAPVQRQPQLQPQPQPEPEPEQDDYLDYEDPYMFIKHLPPLAEAMKRRPSPIPRKAKSAPRITLALDLDETLVHCSLEPLAGAKLTFKVGFKGEEFQVYVRTRPHMDEFLRTVSKWFELILFTASQSVYADTLLDIIDPHKTIIYRVFRESCVYTDSGCYVKDLHILGRDLKTTAIVDNSVQAFAYQLNNGIPIESWFEDPNDRELLKMLPFLKRLKDATDVRPMIRDEFKMKAFIDSL